MFKKLWTELTRKEKRQPQHLVVNAQSKAQVSAEQKVKAHYNIAPSASVKPEGGQ